MFSSDSTDFTNSESEIEYCLEKETLDVSDSNEKASENKNFTYSESKSDSSGSDNIPLAYLFNFRRVSQEKDVLSKDKKIVWKVEPPQQQGRLPSSVIMKKTPGVTRYAISCIFDLKLYLIIRLKII